jgi:hypothetical protein
MMQKLSFLIILSFLSFLLRADDCIKECQLKFMTENSQKINQCQNEKKGKLAKQICISKAQEKTNKNLKTCSNRCVTS